MKFKYGNPERYEYQV